MAELLAARSFPGVHSTDRSFMRGTHAQEANHDTYRYAAAAPAGVDTNGRRYISGLARFPNDPEAWVSVLSDVRRIVRDRGWNCEGAVNYRGFEPADHPQDEGPYVAAPDILDRHVAARLAEYESGDRTEQRIGDLRDTVTQELSGQVDLSPPRVSDYNDPFALPGMEEE
jgi:hypothetical protein